MKIHRLTTLVICLMAMMGLAANLAYADRIKREYKDKRSKPSHSHKDYRKDSRYHHNRSYPRSGHSIKRLPSRHYTIRHRHTHYYYFGGIWYRPSGAHFVVVAPPMGVVVPVLPAYYTTIWYNSIPYYYANDVYYVWRPDRNGYVVTEPPQQIVEQTPPVIADELFIYPKQGQSEQKQADDRYECHRWSVKQTNYDPTKPVENLSVEKLNQKRESYQRANRACLEGRGYSVR